MTALPAVPSTLKCQFIHTSNTVPVYVHEYFHYSGAAPAAADLNAAATTLSTAWNTNYAPITSSGFVLTQIVLTDLTAQTAAQGTWSGSHPGTRVGTPMTANDCVLVNMKIARRYRGGKPRQYWPWGVAGDLNDTQHWGSGFITACTTAIGGFHTTAQAITWTSGGIAYAVNVSYYFGSTAVTTGSATANPPNQRGHTKPTVRTNVPTPDPITLFVPNARVATQRRRQHFST